MMTGQIRHGESIMGDGKGKMDNIYSPVHCGIRHGYMAGRQMEETANSG